MAILVTGNTFATNDQVTAIKLNNIANAATFASGAVDDSTTQLSGGAVIVKDGGISLTSKVSGILPIANGGTAASSASAARTSLGVASAYLESIVTNVNQTGVATGTAMVFNTAGAPTVTLTAGKWLVVGTVAARMSDVAGAAGIRFSDNAGSSFFGAGCAPELSTTRGQVTVQGYKDVTSGTFDVFFYATPIAGSTINLGEATGTSYAGAITAIKLEDTG
jgi:trimeric autotransporter adhesin